MISESEILPHPALQYYLASYLFCGLVYTSHVPEPGIPPSQDGHGMGTLGLGSVTLPK